ncbi:AtpZ/AtpI family protein [Nakamurella leprariae]|uniref:AtpZ/AtpI family protein n=1 Tax=Nakamurella leprariae TaxID=2803911 RepID=A0A938Y9X9_9ACTN|nr:hypothetical protein [Nakamurella leprariae]MBM9465763.1 hypothetical protein [Nakamurella leprariae]
MKQILLPGKRPSSAGSNEGWAVISTLIGGFVVWGGIGWLLDLWWGTRLMTPIGLMIGMALGIYAVVARASATGHADPRPVKTTKPRDETAGPATQHADPISTRRETECP